GHVAGVDLQGLALLGLSVPYLGLGAGALRRHRDFSTLLLDLGLMVVAAAEAILLSGDWLTLAWGVTGAAVAALAVRLEEWRLQAFSLAYLALAFGWTIGEQAPPTALLRSSEHPA